MKKIVIFEIDEERLNEQNQGEEPMEINDLIRQELGWTEQSGIIFKSIVEEFVPLSKPLTLKEIKTMAGDKNRIKTYIKMDFTTFSWDLEDLMDEISERTLGNFLLEDFTYKPVAVAEDGEIILEVEGCVAAFLDDADEQVENETEESKE